MIPMPPSSFSGDTFVSSRDESRLTAQLVQVAAAMSDGQWHTLAELSSRVGAPEASVSARLRDLRKPRFGAYIIERQYVERGLFKYRMAGNSY